VGGANVLKITMVDASALKAYEEGAAWATILLNFAIGFTIAAATATPVGLLTIVALIFWGLFGVAAFRAGQKRRPVTESTKQVSYGLSRSEPGEGLTPPRVL
jgi:hypothetical protein